MNIGGGMLGGLLQKPMGIIGGITQGGGFLGGALKNSSIGSGGLKNLLPTNLIPNIPDSIAGLSDKLKPNFGENAKKWLKWGAIAIAVLILKPWKWKIFKNIF